MTDAALPTAATPLRQIVEARLRARHRQEMRFRIYGRVAISIALAFLFLLVGRIVAQGWTTFVDYRVTVPVFVDPQRIHADDIAGSNFDLMIADQMLARLGTKDD